MKQPIIRRGALVAIALLASAAAWGHLPERMPVHWNLHGEVDRFGSRAEGALLIPAMMLVVWLVAVVAPRIDPRQPSYERMRETYVLVIDVVLAFTFLLHLVLLAAALGQPVPVGRVMPVMVGGLFIVLGNVLPRAKPNWSFGIRTPWTLSSDRVWARTHRVGGYLLVLGGALMVISAFVPRPASVAFLVSGLVPAVAGPILYSYVAWRRETAR